MTTRERMIATALRMFQEHGYHGVSWRNLVSEAGTPWGSIAHHFPGGKLELAVAVVESGGKAVNDLICHCIAKEPSIDKVIVAWFGHTARHMEQSGFQLGCPVASIAGSIAPEIPAIIEASSKAFKTWETTLANSFNQSLTKTRARKLSANIVTLLEGGIVHARIRKSKTPLEEAAKIAQQLVLDSINNS